MIYEALTCITDDLNEHLRNKLKVNEEKVVLSGVVNQDGSLAVKGENKLLATLISIENDTTYTSKLNGSTTGITANANPSIHINLYVLFSAYFTGNNYSESLRFLSFVIAYFQNKNVFTQSNTPNMHKGIEKLIFKIENIGMERQNNIWTMLGAKLMPSVMYKMRMLTFDDAIIREYSPAISGMSSYNKSV